LVGSEKAHKDGAAILNARMMSNLPDPNFRVYFNPPPALRGCGWLGCVAAIFVIGGIVGVLLFGWKTLLGV
jgi:hypothetical protein